MKAYLCGYFYSNLGDDLFVRILCKRYKNVNFIAILNREYTKSFEDIPNLRTQNISFLQKIFYKIAKKILKKDLFRNKMLVKIESKCDFSILLGGSIFQDTKSEVTNNNIINSYPGKATNFVVLGANFGPCFSDNYYTLVSNYLIEAKDVCFRDSYSLEKFSKTKINARLASDIIFGIKSLYKPNIAKDKICSISVIDMANRPDLSQFNISYVDFIVSIIKRYINMGYKINLLSFCKYEGDENAIKNILSKLSINITKKVSTVMYNGKNWTELLFEIARSEKVIATRFHCMILGFAFDVPTLPIIYSSKTKNVINDIFKENKGLDLKDLPKYDLDALEFLKLDNLENIVNDSYHHFDYLDHIWNNNNDDKKV